ncbi:FadR/GntR family transcriptional regulator [Anaerotignum sp. MSJ-24]|uniref:FadR/GntR family transcriptional regulator n=1 Tax=Anaerotignum sp. MSJ-24 TaxID=2841521 RepID=UPI001C12017D|nr:FadR/GntR family transcriptional regulator [Anaerotignum sp. MSJ-24]MBU5464241.1 FadR family transcriptional regulator [Anaerotignum sp. MSJ-24]
MSNRNVMLSEKVADQILKMITLEKRFNLGDKLPNENELAEELGVSRTTLREAVKFLIAHNVLEIRRGKGTFVANNKELNEDYGFSELDNLLLGAMDLFEMRIMFEPSMARYAVERATDEDVAEIVRLGEILQKPITDPHARTEYDQEFHFAIARATKNEFVVKILSIIYAGIEVERVFSLVTKEVNQYTVVDHTLIMEFIKSRDAAGAEAAMRMHILHAYDLTKKLK